MSVCIKIPNILMGSSVHFNGSLRFNLNPQLATVPTGNTSLFEIYCTHPVDPTMSWSLLLQNVTIWSLENSGLLPK